MYARKGAWNVEYRTLNDLVADLVAFPGELFIRDRGCEALVYVPELNEILLVDCHTNGDFQRSAEQCERSIKKKLEQIKAEHVS